jgi:hypothetical protein
MTNKIFPLFIALMCITSPKAQAEWRLTGEAVDGGTAVFIQNPDNSQEFVFTGKLNNRQFKVTDGADTYVADCGDNDPLEQSLALRKESDPSETGLRIRYVKPNEFFSLTIKTSGTTKQLTAIRLTPPSQSLYIMGGPFNHHDPNWLLEDAIEMERDADDPFVFYYRGEIRYNTFGDERGSIKFLLGRTWNDNYHPVGSTNVPLLQATKMRLNGADTKWTIPADRSGDGYYVIQVNTLDETVNVEFTPGTAIHPVTQSGDIHIYASGGNLFLRGNPQTEWEAGVFSIDGKKVAGKTFTGAAEIALPAGFYLVKAVSGDGKQITRKVKNYER